MISPLLVVRNAQSCSCCGEGKDVIPVLNLAFENECQHTLTIRLLKKKGDYLQSADFHRQKELKDRKTIRSPSPIRQTTRDNLSFFVQKRGLLADAMSFRRSSRHGDRTFQSLFSLLLSNPQISCFHIRLKQEHGPYALTKYIML